MFFGCDIPAEERTASKNDEKKPGNYLYKPEIFDEKLNEDGNAEPKWNEGNEKAEEKNHNHFHHFFFLAEGNGEKGG